MRRIILNADDYGISPSVSCAIRTLIGAERLSATSCMVTSPYWADAARVLRETPNLDKIQVGMHLTLTDQPAATNSPNLSQNGYYLSLGQLWRRLHLRRVGKWEIEDHLRQQWTDFVQKYGEPPAFIDGHHHVHQFPLIRDAVLDFVTSISSDNRPWIRNCWEAPFRLLSRRVASSKALFIGSYGLTLRRQCEARGVNTNIGFAGIYNFDKVVSFPSLMDRFLDEAVDGTVIMCHPGFIDEKLRAVDSLVEPRKFEFDYLMSDSFGRRLREMKITLRASSLFSKHPSPAQMPPDDYETHKHSSP